MNALYREDLDGMRCSVAGCDHKSHDNEPLFFHGACHIRSDVEISYHNGQLLVGCATCQKPIALIAVAGKTTG